MKRPYGITSERGKMFMAHRVAYELCVRKIPLGFLVLHRCDNPLCVNPQHLFLGTQRDNVRDCMRKGRRSSRKGEANGRAKLTRSDVVQIRQLLQTCTVSSVAKQYGLATSHVSRIRLRQAWSTILDDCPMCGEKDHKHHRCLDFGPEGLS